MKPCKLDLTKPTHVRKLEAIYKDPNYIVEEKIDGCHYTVIHNRFFSTHISEKTAVPVEKTDAVGHLVEVLEFLNMPLLILDGEIFIPGGKSNNVTSLIGGDPLNAMSRQRSSNQWVKFKVFDVLRDHEGNWMGDKPWRIRRQYLELLFNRIEQYTPLIQLNKIYMNDKEAIFDGIISDGGEGVVLKNVQSVYSFGKRPMWQWIKIKAEMFDDVVIMGFEPPKKLYTGPNVVTWPFWEDGEPVTEYHFNRWIGSITMGKYQDGKLVKVGTCSGITEEQRKKFTESPEQFIGLVMEIRAMERTADGAYRHPSFIRIHPDKNANEVLMD